MLYANFRDLVVTDDPEQRKIFFEWVPKSRDGRSPEHVWWLVGEVRLRTIGV